MSRCLSIAVIRLDDRQVLARYDATATSQDGDAASQPLPLPALPKFDLGDLSLVAAKVAAAAVNRTRLQLDLVDPAANSAAAQLSGQLPSGNNNIAAPPGTQIHAVVSRPKNIAIAAVCTREASPRTAFVLCDTALAQFERMFLERASALTPAQCAASFRATLSESVVKFNSAMVQMSAAGGGDEKIQLVKRAVEDTKAAVMENIDKALDRGAKIESIVEASAELSDNAQTFEAHSRALERNLWWKSMKMKLMVGGAAIAIVLVVLMMTCGRHCIPGRSGSDAAKKDLSAPSPSASSASVTSVTVVTAPPQG